MSLDDIVPSEVHFENELSQNIATKILELNSNLEDQGSIYRVRVVSNQSNLLVRPSGAQMLDISDDVDRRLAGFPDLRLQEKSPKGIIAKEGFQTQKNKSGMTIALIDIQDQLPVAVSNFLLFSPTEVEQEAYILKGEDNLKVVNFRQAFQWDEKPTPFRLTPGWHYILSGNRYSIQIARLGYKIADIVVEGIKSEFEDTDQTVVILGEQNGQFYDVDDPKKDFLNNLGLGDIVYSNDERLKLSNNINLFDVVGQVTQDSRAVATVSSSKGMTLYRNIIPMRSFGRVFMADINEWQASK